MTMPGSAASGSGGGTLKRKQKKEKPQMENIQPTQLRKQLLTKIKDYQNKVEKADTKKGYGNKNLEEAEKEFNDDFNKSLSFLEDLSTKKKKQEIGPSQPSNTNTNTNTNTNYLPQHRRLTLKKPREEVIIATELPPELAVDYNANFDTIQPSIYSPIVEAVTTTAPISFPDNNILPYGNLKHGTKPTFRQWNNKTIKNNGNSYSIPDIKPGIRIIEENDSTSIPSTHTQNKPSLRQEVFEKIKEEYKAEKAAARPESKPDKINISTDEAIAEAAAALCPLPQIKRTRISKTLKYKLGKCGNKVAVLIKNMKTRKLVQHEYALLKQKNLLEIKNHLREKNLLKAGSDAPADVLRQMYEQSILTGDVDNKAKDILIHNYMSPL